MTLATPILILALVAAPSGGDGSGPVILDFTAGWCGPCQQMRPAVEELSRKGYPIRAIDIDDHPELAQKYGVSSVPTFVAVDADGRELGRTQGSQPASGLVSLYRQALAKARPAAVPARAAAVPDAPAADEEPAPAARAGELPDPWKSAVRIRIHGAGSIGFGSGTVIHSTPDEAIILTCAHIFKMENTRQQPHPSRFPRKITVDLFDGELHGPRKQLKPIETVAGEAIDYDFGRDVGLIRIRPGRRLPSSRVVPPGWQPRPGMQMTTVGCSLGYDATPWTTWVLEPARRVALNNSPEYEATKCKFAPKQGRSGGGLYTLDGLVAGVCDFAEPQANWGLYASPRSIHQILDRNGLAALYDPNATPRGDGALLARDGGKAPRAADAPTVRAQSPDPRPVTIPAPELLGIRSPALAAGSPGRPTWRASVSRAHTAESAARAVPTDLETTPLLDSQPAPAADHDPSPAPPASRGGWRAAQSPLPPLSDARSR